MTTPNTNGLAPEVAQAIEEVKVLFPAVGFEADGSGGAHVTVTEVPLGPTYQQETTWVGFHLLYNYPATDVYPHFVREDLCRADGCPLGEGTSINTFRDKPAVMLSRRSGRWDPAADTAALKLLKVIQWLNGLA